jgi:hypothetical protein
MKILLKYVVVLVAAYLVVWTASYMVVMHGEGDGLDFSLFFSYLKWAWTFSGGELPTFIWLFSVIAFLPLAALAVFLLRRHERRKNNKR